jgi:hypothetical protein
MTVDTDMPVRETTDLRPTTADAADTQELLRTMAAMVRTVFGVALQTPADAPAEHGAGSGQLPPAPISLPDETPTLVSVPVTAPGAPASIAVDFPPAVEVQQPEQPIGLSVVPDTEPTDSLAVPSISLGDSPWTPPPAPPAPVEPAASLPSFDGYPVAIPIPGYAAPTVPSAPSADRHSLALLQEVAFLDD